MDRAGIENPNQLDAMEFGGALLLNAGRFPTLVLPSKSFGPSTPPYHCTCPKPGRLQPVRLLVDFSTTPTVFTQCNLTSHHGVLSHCRTGPLASQRFRLKAYALEILRLTQSLVKKCTLARANCTGSTVSFVLEFVLEFVVYWMMIHPR